MAGGPELGPGTARRGGVRPHPLSRQTRSPGLAASPQDGRSWGPAQTPHPQPFSALRTASQPQSEGHSARGWHPALPPTLGNSSPQKRVASPGTGQCRGHREESEANPEPSLPLRGKASVLTYRDVPLRRTRPGWLFVCVTCVLVFEFWLFSKSQNK